MAICCVRNEWKMQNSDIRKFIFVKIVKTEFMFYMPETYTIQQEWNCITIRTPVARNKSGFSLCYVNKLKSKILFSLENEKQIFLIKRKTIKNLKTRLNYKRNYIMCNIYPSILLIDIGIQIYYAFTFPKKFQKMCYL